MMEENELFFEEEKEPNRKHSNTTTIVLIVLILLIIAFSTIITFIKFSNKEKTENKDSEPIVTEKDNYQTITFDCDDTCEYDLTLNKDKVLVSYTTTVGTNENYNHKITIGDKVITNREYNCGGPAKMMVLEDVIIISYHDGCDVYGNSIVAYDKDGNELFNYKYLDYNNYMRVDNTDFDIKDKTILINGSRVTTENTVFVSETKELSLCETLGWQSYGIEKNTILFSKYSIEYNGDYSFKDPIIYSNTKYVSDYTDKCNSGEDDTNLPISDTGL